MGIGEKLEELREKKEAKKYFNENNDVIPGGLDYLKAILAGLVLAIIGGFLVMQLSYTIDFYIGYAFLAIGYVVGYGAKKATGGKGGIKLGILVLVTYLIGVIIGTLCFYLNIIGLDPSFIDMAFINGVLEMMFGDFFAVIMHIVGAFIAFSIAKD